MSESATPAADEPNRLRLLVVADQAVVRMGFAALLEAHRDLLVVGVADNGRSAIEAARRLAPDVVLMDIRMPVMDGIEATRAMNALPGPPRVLILTTFDLDEHVYAALRAGASGFLLKDATPEQILHAVRVVGAGDALLDPGVTRRLIVEFAAHAVPSPPAQLETLTARERDVLMVLARGRSNLEIARELHLAEQTVKSHVSAVLLKLGLRDRVQAVVFCYEAGLVVAGTEPAN
jgi:DNA-binding NarL/FixJ family response regulator